LPQGLGLGFRPVHRVPGQRGSLQRSIPKIHFESGERQRRRAQFLSRVRHAGSLDEPSRFRPTIAVFTRNRPPWALLPPDLKAFERGC
jgi:hypothetical protein